MKKPFGATLMKKVRYDQASTVGTCTWSGAPPNQTSDDQD